MKQTYTVTVDIYTAGTPGIVTRTYILTTQYLWQAHRNAKRRALKGWPATAYALVRMSG